MMEHKEITLATGEIVIARLNDDGSTTFIPKDEANADYQAYLNPDKVEHLTEIPTV
jgi:hypothetical protein